MIEQISQNDYTILKQQTINKYIRLDILDYNFNIVDEVSGDLINLSVSVNADSDLRRSCQVELVVKGNGYKVQSGGKIWLDKYIRPWVGYESIHTGEIRWYNQGVFLINAPTYNYDATTKRLSFEGLDLMSKLTGVRDGQLEGLETIIHQGENVRDVIISTISQLGGFKKYIVNNCQYQNGEIQNVPNDIEINQGGTVYDILKQLRDILPNYEIFFNTDGTFIYQTIPTGKNESILIDDDLLSQIIISEDVTVNFENVKNVVEVWGQTHDVDNFATNVNINGNEIELTIPSITSLSAEDIISFDNPTEINDNLIICTVKNIPIQGGVGFTASAWQEPFAPLFIFLENNTGATCTYGGQLWHSPTYPKSYIAKDLSVKKYKASRFWFNFESETIVNIEIHIVKEGKTVVWEGMVDEDCNKTDGLTIRQYKESVTTTIKIPAGSHFIDYIVFRPTNNYAWAEITINVPQASVKTSFAIMKQTLVPLTHLGIGTQVLVWNGVNWMYLGHQQAQAVAKDENPESPFYIYGSVGEIRLVLYGGEYDNIYSDDLAQQRANYELWKRTRLEDTITLTCVPIPWLDVNQLVEYTSHESGETHQYIIKSITTDYNETGTQTIVMSRYYPLYPDI